MMWCEVEKSTIKTKTIHFPRNFTLYRGEETLDRPKDIKSLNLKFNLGERLIFSLFYINRKHFTIEEKRSEGSPNFHNTIPLSILRGGAQKCLGLQHYTLLITLT